MMFLVFGCLFGRAELHVGSVFFVFFLTRVRLYCEQDGREWGSGQPETERMSPALEVRSLKQVLDPGLLLMKACLRMFWWNSLWSGIKPSLSFKTGSETSQQRPRTESWVKQKNVHKNVRDVENQRATFIICSDKNLRLLDQNFPSVQPMESLKVSP